MTLPVWTTARLDWRERIKRRESLMPCGPIFPAEAEAGMQVFRSLPAVGVPHPDGGGVTPTTGMICGEWAQEIAAAIHGGYNAETGERLIREVFLKVPKKNWKSGWAAMLMLSLLVRNWRESNEAAIIAPTKEGADNVFKPMRDAIRADPELSELFHIQPNMRTVTHRVTGMSCRVYAADTDTVAGKIWAFVILEELWQLAKRNGAEDMLLEALGGQASRPEGVVISITTEADEPPVGVYKTKLEFARKVRDGTVDAPWFLPILYEWPEDMLKAKAYMEPANFHLVNPNYGASVDPVDMLRKFEEAKEAGGKPLHLFLAKRLNVPPSENIGGSWAGAKHWVAQAGRVELETLLERCEVITAGVDGGGLDDLLGLALVGREREKTMIVVPEHVDEEGRTVPEHVAERQRWLLWTRAWAEKGVLELRKSEAERLRGFKKDGHLVLVDRIGDDVDELAGIVGRIEKAGLLNLVGVDPAGIGQVLDALEAAKVPAEKVVSVSQGWRLSGAIKTAERKLAAGEMVHDDQPMMAWCVGNAKVEPKGNAMLITKQASGTAKIDPLMAAFNAIELMSRNPASPSADLGGFFRSPVIA